MQQPPEDQSRSIVVRPGEALMAVFEIDENGEEVLRYYVGRRPQGEQVRTAAIEDALTLAGAWSDLDCDELVDALDHRRHEVAPTSPIDEL